MDPSNSANSGLDEDMALEILLDAFGSACSLEDIASAYCRARCDINTAGEILSQLQESRSSNGYLLPNDTVENAKSVETPLENDVESCYLFKKSYLPKPKKFTVSTGTVSTVLGKGYFHPTPSQSEQLKAIKPLKLELKEPLVEDDTCESVISDFACKTDLLSKNDSIEFLFSMLGDGFKLDKDMISDVLGSCGFDVKKTMEHIWAMASMDVDKGKMVDCSTTKDPTDKLPTLGTQLSEGNLVLSSAQRKSSESCSSNDNRSDVPREVLESLFCVPGRSEEAPKRTRLQFGLNRTRVVGRKVVSAPLDDIDPKPELVMAKEIMKDVENEDDSYLILRRVTKQSWEIMKAYYEAAVDAFMEGDRAKADYLLQQGKYHNKIAREADEKSAKEILDGRSAERQSDFILDLHTHHAKEAAKLLKFHLQSFAGIPSYQYMKVIVDNGSEDTTKGKRRKMVLKLLEKESIDWTEENPGTICIQLDAIEPSKLSFVKDLQND